MTQSISAKIHQISEPASTNQTHGNANARTQETRIPDFLTGQLILTCFYKILLDTVEQFQQHHTSTHLHSLHLPQHQEQLPKRCSHTLTQSVTSAARKRVSQLHPLKPPNHHPGQKRSLMAILCIKLPIYHSMPLFCNIFNIQSHRLLLQTRFSRDVTRERRAARSTHRESQHFSNLRILKQNFFPSSFTAP